MSWAGPPRSARRLLTAIGILAGLSAVAVIVVQLSGVRGRSFALVVILFGLAGLALVIAGVLRAWRGARRPDHNNLGVDGH